MKKKILFSFFVVLAIYLLSDQRFALEIFVGILPFVTIYLWQRKVALMRDKYIAYVAKDIFLTLLFVLTFFALEMVVIKIGERTVKLSASVLLVVLLMALFTVIVWTEKSRRILNQKAVYLFLIICSVIPFGIFPLSHFKTELAIANLIGLVAGYIFFVPKRIKRIYASWQCFKYAAWKMLF